MRIGVDSSVLLAAIHVGHPLHAVAARWLASHVQSDDVCVAHHSVVECYSALTRLPGHFRLAGDEARRLLEATVPQNMTLAAFDVASIWDILDALAAAQITGGRTYDAFIAEILRRFGVEAIATFNRDHFLDIAPDLLIIDPARPENAGGG